MIKAGQIAVRNRSKRPSADTVSLHPVLSKQALDGNTLGFDLYFVGLSDIGRYPIMGS
jgi:hypothetical protein